MIESKGYKITPIDGDLAVSRNAEIGGDADIHGKARVAGSLKVEGFLDSPNIKGAVKGLFATEEELKREYPNPRPGWCAIVLADKENGFLYLAKNREWEKQSEETQPFDFIVDSINVFASKGELGDLENKVNANADDIYHLKYGMDFRPEDEAVELMLYQGAGDSPIPLALLPSADGSFAGVMSAEDKRNLNNSTVKVVTWNNDTDLSNMNDFVVAGVYDIKGEHMRKDDNLPILNTCGGHSFNARLTVLDSSISGSGKDDDKCITQVLSFSNRLGQGEVYIRTGKGSSLDSLSWEKWSTLQRNVNVEEIGSLDDLKDNGIYSGVWLFGSLNNYPLTFVCVVINDYFIGTAPRRISQFVYGLSKFDGSVVYQSRVWDDSKDKWSDWEILNKNEINSMITDAVDVATKAFNSRIDNLIDGAPETLDTLKEIADWVNTHEDLYQFLESIVNLNTQAIEDEKTRAENAEKDIKRKAVDVETLNASELQDKVNVYFRNLNGVQNGFTIPAATTTAAGVMSAEDKEKLDINDVTLSNVVTTTVNNYSDVMEWELVCNNKENSTDYISSVQKNDDGSILLTPSVGGKNMPITTYIGTPKSGETVNITLGGLSKVDQLKITTGSTSTKIGTILTELTNNNGVWSAKVKSNGKALYLYLFVSWSATPSSPATIGSCSINGYDVQFIEDFATREDLITEKLAIIPKSAKSYNPGNGALENSTSRFGSGLIRVKEGMVLFSDAPQDYYFVLFDYNKNYIRYDRPYTGYLQGGYYRVAEGVEYVAITSYTNFEKLILKVVDESVPVMFPVTYREALFQPWNQVPAALRKNGVMVTYQLPSGENVIEVFQDPGNINLVSNSFGTKKYWKRLAYTDIVRGINPHPMKDKTFYSIGDSHRWKWLDKLAEITGATSGGDIFEKALAANEKFYVSRVVSMAKYIVDLYKSGKPVDYIFLEYVHKYFVNNIEPANWYHYSGDITEAEPFLTQAYYDYTQNTFNNTSEAKSFWDNNFATIVGGFTPKSNAIIALKTDVKVQSPKFKLSGSATTSGKFTIKFTDNSGELHQMSIAIPSGLSINEALTIVNEIEFSDSGSKWDNLSAHNTITDAIIKFTYNGNLNDADASIKMGFDFGTTGIVYDGDWTINTETKDWIRGFKSHDVSKWEDKEKWNDLWANADAYIWIKAAVELLQREIPTAKIFVWTLCTESWNYTDNTIEGKSVLYPDGTLNVQAIYDSLRHKRMVQNVEGWEKVAKYYHLGFIPISEMNSISPANHKYYYASEDVHPTQEGYDRVAEILADNVY